MSIEAIIRQIVRDEVRAAIDERLADLRAREPVGEQYLSAKRAAAVAGVSVSTIRRWWSQGKLPVSGRPRLRRVRRSDLEGFLDRERSTAPSIEEMAKAIRGD